jgi:hypothetical protein
MIAALNLLAEGVSVGDLGLVIKQPEVNLLDTRLVLVRFPVFLQMGRGPWGIYNFWLKAGGS